MDDLQDKLLIFGYGNPSRGDDALGPLIIEKLCEWQFIHGWSHIQAETDYQLQIEHVSDLVDQDLVIFVDADMGCAPPLSLSICDEQTIHGYTSHALSPHELLGVYRLVHRSKPPPSYIVHIRGEQFELGQPLSASANDNLAIATSFLKELCSLSLQGGARSYCETAVSMRLYA